MSRKLTSQIHKSLFLSLEQCQVVFNTSSPTALTLKLTALMGECRERKPSSWHVQMRMSAIMPLLAYWPLCLQLRVPCVNNAHCRADKALLSCHLAIKARERVRGRELGLTFCHNSAGVNLHWGDRKKALVINCPGCQFVFI